MKITMVCVLLLISTFIASGEGKGESVMRIDKVYEVPFPVAVVYAAWVSSDTVIPPATAMDVLPEVGGHYRLIMETPDFSGRNEGQFLRVEPERRVTYTWEWNQDGEVTEIDVRFLPSEHGTRVVLSHTGFVRQDSVNNHDTGWDSYIEQFIQHLASR